MACIYCDATMHNLGSTTGGDPIFWCSRCGAIKTEHRSGDPGRPGRETWDAPLVLVGMAEVANEGGTWTKFLNWRSIGNVIEHLRGKRVVERFENPLPVYPGADAERTINRANMQAAQICRATIDELDTIVEEQLSGLTVPELYHEGNAWIAEPHHKLTHATMRWPRNAAAMMAVHYYRALCRKIESASMDESINLGDSRG